MQVSATDADIGLNGRIRYVLSDKDTDDGTFVIDPTSGVVRTNKGLDRESVAQYELQAIAVDRGSPALSSEVRWRPKVRLMFPYLRENLLFFNISRWFSYRYQLQFV